MCRRAVAPLQDHVVTEVLRGPIGAEFGGAHQIANELHEIALHIEAEISCGNLVAPFNTPLGIEQHDAVGRGLQRRQDLLQACLAFPDLCLRLAQQTARAIGGLAPHAAQLRHRRQITHAQPPQHPCAAPQVQRKPAPGGEPGPHQRPPHPFLPPAYRTADQLEYQKYAERENMPGS